MSKSKWIAFCIGIVLFVGTIALLRARTVAALDTVTQRVEEDDPLWDCTTMGNKVCGSMTHSVETPQVYPMTGKLTCEICYCNEHADPNWCAAQAMLGNH